MLRGLRCIGKDENFSVTNITDVKKLDAELEKEPCDLLIYELNNIDQFNFDSLVRLILTDTTKKLIISNTLDKAIIYKLLDSGVQGYLTHSCDEEELLLTIRTILKGEKMYCQKVLDMVINRSSDAENNCAASNLSSRESEIACLIANGCTNKEVACQLCLSPHTVHTHRKNIMKKLGVRSASELTMSCLRLGIIKA